jgi:hypothetical protein
MRKDLRLMAAAPILWACSSGCMTPAEQQASDGLTAFKACDLRTASADFEAAHTLDTSRADFALAYAMSTLAVLAEDPAVTALLLRLGFGPAPTRRSVVIDTSIFWGPTGVLNQLSTGTSTCQSINNYLDAHIAYAPLQDNGPSAASVIADPTLTGDDFVAAAAALSPRLDELVQALEMAAGSGAAETDITGGCGVGTVYIEAPELYGLAAGLELVRAAIQVGQGYDWGVAATLAFDYSGREPQMATALNAHILHVISAASVGAAAPTAAHAVQLFQRGLTAAAAITQRPPNSLFDWAQMPPGTIADLQNLAGAAETMLTVGGKQTVPYCTPALTMNGLSFFNTPVDATNLQPPIWSAVPWSDPSGDSGVDIDSSSQGLETQVENRFSPNPFATGATFSCTAPDSLTSVSSDAWTAVFDPDKRWDNLYMCMN